MFEIIGLLILRLYGWGWLWGRRDWRDFQNSNEDVFGNGGSLLIVGLASFIAHAGIGVAVVIAIGRWTQ